LRKKYKAHVQGGEKTVQEKGNPKSQNFFSVLDNDEIVCLAVGMGVVVQKENFDTIDIMKDLEIARVTLNKNKIVPCPDNCEEVKPVDEIQQEEVPLLEWIKNGSEAEHFTLVQSKKKRNKKSQLEKE
jgi:hypothetical protein